MLTADCYSLFVPEWPNPKTQSNGKQQRLPRQKGRQINALELQEEHGSDMLKADKFTTFDEMWCTSISPGRATPSTTASCVSAFSTIFLCLIPRTWQFLEDWRPRVEFTDTQRRASPPGQPTPGQDAGPRPCCCYGRRNSCTPAGRPRAVPFMHVNDTAVLCDGKDISTARRGMQLVLSQTTPTPLTAPLESLERQ